MDNPIGILNETVALSMVISPYVDPQEQMRAFLKNAAQPGAKLRTMIYGCTWAPFFDAVIEAKEAGADVKIIFDHTQALGPKEKTQIDRLVATGFKDGTDFMVGTSMLHHQIVHLKRTAIWLPNGNAMVEFGSWNYSDSASLQLNDVTIVQSAHIASFTDLAFNQLWAWISNHEQAMQIFGAA